MQEAIEILQREGTLIFPTETVYGLGARFDSDKALAKIFTAKGRPADNPLILHVADITWVERLAQDIPEKAYALMESFWPGPLSIVLRKKPEISPRITAGLPSVAIRFPSHPLARKLLEGVGIPVAAPSANPSGRPSPTREIDVLEMEGRVDGILLGGDARVGLESTVLDLSGEIPRILRPGAVTMEQIRAFLPETIVYSGASDKAPSPGLRHKHYAPDAKVFLLKGSPASIADFVQRASPSSCFLLPEGLALGYDEERIITFVPGGDLEKAAARLYSALRDADRQGRSEIYIAAFSSAGIGEALMDRVLRAAQGRIVTLEEV